MTVTFLTLTGGSATESPEPHVVLVGLPGAGKSVVGAAAADRLGRPFLDLDREIERRQGTSVEVIFAEHGEARFRKLEIELSRELAAFGGMIVAPGGGWATVPDSVALLRPPARIIYLRVSPARALQRLGPEASTRPLLRHPDPLGELERLLAARTAAYEAADEQIDTELMSPQQVTDTVVELVGSSGHA